MAVGTDLELSYLAQTIRGTEVVIAYAIRTLTKCETNCVITDRGGIVVVWAIIKFLSYPYSAHLSTLLDDSPVQATSAKNTFYTLTDE